MSSTPKEGNDGTWNSIRETIVCTISDLNGKEFVLRLLVDPGASISSLLAYTLYYSKAKWDCEQIRPIPIKGINSVTACDLVCHAPIKPSKHLSKEFRSQVNMPDNFQLEVDFYVLKGPEVYTAYKRELPQLLRDELVKQTSSLADPEQAAPQDSLLYIHGILGVQAIQRMKRQTFQPVLDSELTLCRSLFGDLLFGTSHFVPDRPVTTTHPMSDNNDRENAKHVECCSLSLWIRGLRIDKSCMQALMQEEANSQNNYNQGG